jgi:hypothetical protein
VGISGVPAEGSGVCGLPYRNNLNLGEVVGQVFYDPLVFRVAHDQEEGAVRLIFGRLQFGLAWSARRSGRRVLKMIARQHGGKGLRGESIAHEPDVADCPTPHDGQRRPKRRAVGEGIPAIFLADELRQTRMSRGSTPRSRLLYRRQFEYQGRPRASGRLSSRR